MQKQNALAARNLIRFFLAVFLFSLSVSGQTPTPTPDEETIRVNTDLIQTNVTVVDKDNRFVNDLKREQFEVRIDEKPVPIEFFNQIIVERQNENSKNGSESQKPPALNFAPSLRDRKIIFFVDDLHLSLDSLNRTKQAINRFIDDEMMTRDSVLIVSASGRIGFLQQFTDNKAVLRAALERLKYAPVVVRDTELPPMPEGVAIRILNNDKEAADFYVEEIFKGFNSKKVATMNQRGAMEMVRNRASFIVGGMVSVSETTLGSLENLLQTTNQIAGRKLIFFASDGFYLGSKNTGVVDNTRLQNVVNSATRSGSVIYTIDARGLFNLLPDATGDRPTDQRGRIDRGRIGEEQLSQEALFTLAEQTGGEFLKNQNYFDKWIDRTLDKNANYYLLGWLPETETPSDKKFRQIEVSVVGRPDLTVRLQRGYLTNTTNAQNNSSKNKTDKTAVEKTNTPKTSPDKKNLPVTLALNYLDFPNLGGVLTNSVQISTAGLDFSNNQAATIDLAGVVFNDQGKQVADFKTGLKIDSRPQTDAEQNVIYNQRTPLAPGIYQVKVGAREAKSGQTGTAVQWIEIPDLTKKRLTLGSLLLGVQSLKKSEKPDDTQIQFSVDHNFDKPLKLDFMSFIYNAARGGNGEMNLATKIEIYDQNGRAIVNTPMRPLSTKGLDDLARIPLSGAIKQETSQPGNYLLRITVNDLVANSSVVQQTTFIIE